MMNEMLRQPSQSLAHAGGGDPPITVTLTIEEDGYAPISVERAVLSLFSDRLEVSVPQTRFTVTIYLRDVYQLDPWTPEGNALIFHTGVFAPRTYILQCSVGESPAGLRMLYDLIQSKVLTYTPPPFPMARHPAHTALQQRFFANMEAPYHTATTSNPFSAGNAPATNLEHWATDRHPRELFASGTPSHLRRLPPAMPEALPSSNSRTDSGLPHHHAINRFIDSPTSVPPWGPSAMGASPRDAAKSNDGSDTRNEMGHLLPCAPQRENALVDAEVQTISSPKWVEQHHSLSAPQSTLLTAAAPPPPPQGPIASPQPPLWLLQRNLSKIEERDQLLHQRVLPTANGNSDNLDAATAFVSRVLADDSRRLDVAAAVPSRWYEMLQLERERNEFNLTAPLISSATTHPQKGRTTTSSPILSPASETSRLVRSPTRVTLAMENDDDAESTANSFTSSNPAVEVAARRLSAKASMAALERNRGAITREDVVSAIAGEKTSTPVSSKAQSLRLPAGRSTCGPVPSVASPAPPPSAAHVPISSAAPPLPVYKIQQKASAVVAAGADGRVVASGASGNPEDVDGLYRSYTGIPTTETIVIDPDEEFAANDAAAVPSSLSGQNGVASPTAATELTQQQQSSVGAGGDIMNAGEQETEPPRAAAPLPAADDGPRDRSNSINKAQPPRGPTVRPPSRTLLVESSLPQGAAPLPHMLAHAATQVQSGFSRGVGQQQQPPKQQQAVQQQQQAPPLPRASTSISASSSTQKLPPPPGYQRPHLDGATELLRRR